MEITEVKVNVIAEGDQRLLAFCSVTFDQQFVVRDLRIIRKDGQLFVAMPSRKVTSVCHRCHGRNVFDSAYCNHCGCPEPASGEKRSGRADSQPFTDIAHPITKPFRDKLEQVVIAEYERQLKKATRH